MNRDMRTTVNDHSQRMLTAIEPGTIIFEAKDGSYGPLAPEDMLNV